MVVTIPVAHDFICPWCWVGLLQARRLEREFGVSFEWLSYELIPDALEWSTSTPASPPPANKAPTPSRFDLIKAADGVVMPAAERPKQMRTHNAHEAVEYAKTEGVADALVERLYRALWEDGETINDPVVLRRLAAGIVMDLDALDDAIRNRRFEDKIIGFDEDAYASGVYNVPTFFIGGEKYAEQPYVVLRQAVKNALGAPEGTSLYSDLAFPAAPVDRPYTFINMVTTIDGKSVSGTRDESVSDLGSKIDRLLMRRIESAADAIMTGAQTIRATSPAWDPMSPRRIAVTRSGDVPQHAAFFECGESYVAACESAAVEPFGQTQVLRAGRDSLDFPLLLSRLRKEMGVERLLVSGGSELNAELLRLDLVDELFWTVAPKVKLGHGLPTYAGGDPLPREALLRFELMSEQVIGDELFLRYRRRR
ncbi:dihydrofolate reductase family protein [Fimbriimonas ginsengisoli]|uniref:dihydrofolate reductase family protein n=1 Tax=Fimbriimonas ginsengisoli TaxID=1005039 RepID=UPI0005701ED2|nr:dihydrofolate reductase family protein [Fimbriimonas ginsengisoli]